jgi:hypothetical protein
MTTLQETANKVLKTIYNDSRVNTKEYSEIEALEELKDAIKFLIKERENKFAHLSSKQ